MHVLVLLLLLIWQSLEHCAPGLIDTTDRLYNKGLIKYDTKIALRSMTHRACHDPVYREREWYPYFKWGSRNIPNRELEQEFSAVREQAYRNMRSKEQ